MRLISYVWSVDQLVGWSVGRSVFSGRDRLAIYVLLLLLEGETDDILNCLGMEGVYVITYLRVSKRLCNCQLSGTSLFVIFKRIKLESYATFQIIRKLSNELLVFHFFFKMVKILLRYCFGSCAMLAIAFDILDDFLKARNLRFC